MRIEFPPLLPAHLPIVQAMTDKAMGFSAPRLEAGMLCVPRLSVLVTIDDQPVAAGGVIPLAPGRGGSWFVGHFELPRRAWPAITAKAIELHENAHAAGIWRIEAQVARGFGAGCRWIRRLGFGPPEGIAQQWLPDRSDVFQYARIRP